MFKKHFESKKWGPKKIWVKQIFGPKNSMGQKNLLAKNVISHTKS